MLHVFFIVFDLLVLVNYPEEQLFIKIKVYIYINNDKAIQIEFWDTFEYRQYIFKSADSYNAL